MEAVVSDAEEVKKELSRRSEEFREKEKSMSQLIEMLLKEKEELESKVKKSKAPSVAPPKPPPGLSPLQKLERDYTVCQNDLKRVLSKLSATEQKQVSMQEKLNLTGRQLSDANRKIGELEKEKRLLNDKLETAEQKIVKAECDTQAFHELQTMVQSMGHEMAQLKEKLSLTTQDRDNGIDELKEANAKHCQFLEKNRALELQLANFEGTVQELNAQIAKSAQTYSDNIDQMTQELQQSNDKIDKLSSQLSSVGLEKDRLSQQLTENKDAFEANSERLESKASEMELLLETTRLESDQKLKESRLTHKIQQKKQNQMLRELQKQLKQEVIISQQLKCKVLKLEDELKDNQSALRATNIGNPNIAAPVALQSNSHTHTAVTTATASSEEESNASFGTTQSLTASPQPYGNDLLRPPPPPPPLLRPNNSGATALQWKEVTNALSAKLQQSEEKNFSLKQQLKYLQDTIQALHGDIGSQKAIVANLTRRFELGQLSNNNSVPSTSSAMNNRWNNNLDKELYDKMQCIFEETLLTNQMLRRDIDAMGLEMHKLFTANQQLTKERLLTAESETVPTRRNVSDDMVERVITVSVDQTATVQSGAVSDQSSDDGI